MKSRRLPTFLYCIFFDFFAAGELLPKIVSFGKISSQISMNRLEFTMVFI